MYIPPLLLLVPEFAVDFVEKCNKLFDAICLKESEESNNIINRIAGFCDNNSVFEADVFGRGDGDGDGCGFGNADGYGLGYSEDESDGCAGHAYGFGDGYSDSCGFGYGNGMGYVTLLGYGSGISPCARDDYRDIDI